MGIESADEFALFSVGQTGMHFEPMHHPVALAVAKAWLLDTKDFHLVGRKCAIAIPWNWSVSNANLPTINRQVGAIQQPADGKIQD